MTVKSRRQPLKRTAALALAVSALCMMTVLSSLSAQSIVHDNTLGFRYGTTFAEPGIRQDIAKNILAITHVDTHTYGSSFLNIDMLMSAGNDPANGSSNHGAREFYVVYRHALSLNALTHSNSFAWPGFLKDVAIDAGMDWNSKNTTFAPEKRLIVVGPQLQFAVPKGFLNLSLNYSRENNYNGIVGKAVAFSAAFEVEATWSFPLPFAPSAAIFNGFLNYVAPKGRDGFGAETSDELLARPELMLDLSQLTVQKKGALEVGVAYEYWLNKYGNNHRTVAGALARTPMLSGRLHF